ncbi:hypothetical protein [Fusobacterium polymorphum]|uniref:hypothetical protein n=1 Tax=Fusobacterium nucleatum subsp. polymorphum TaxID=76857 RepID=UPI003008E3B3
MKNKAKTLLAGTSGVFSFLIKYGISYILAPSPKKIIYRKNKNAVFKMRYKNYFYNTHIYGTLSSLDILVSSEHLFEYDARENRIQII